MPAARSTPATRSILIVQADGSEMIVENIPANAKITFAPVQPGGRDFHASRTHCVRIYTSTNNQLAVFENARSFRDLSLTVKTKTVTIKESSETVSGANKRRRTAAASLEAVWED